MGIQSAFIPRNILRPSIENLKMQYLSEIASIYEFFPTLILIVKIIWDLSENENVIIKTFPLSVHVWNFNEEANMRVMEPKLCLGKQLYKNVM